MEEMQNELSLGACVVLYNPGPEVINNIRSYSAIAEKIVVADNSTEKTEINSQIAAMDKVVYIDMHGNSGIAAAMNAGLDYLYENGMKIALTMDQDSIFPVSQKEEILDRICRYSDKYSVLCLGYKKMRWIEKYNGEIADVDCWISSGSFIRLSDYKLVNGFNSELFIDSVDHEFCWKLWKQQKKIGVICRCYLEHSIGSPKGTFYFLGTKYSFSSNHPPIRYYYRYRNIVYLHHVDKKFFSDTYNREIFINIFRMLIFDDNRIKKIKMIVRGIRDGKNRKLGRYS